ncbi:MAG TPA: response regulator transcription factor [Terriglobales bacterium]|nr:response regulator transcription factor [Terriglobales bacterium]
MDRKPAARVLIADDHRLLAEACQKMLEPEFQVVAIVTDGRGLVRAAAEHRPDLAIIDIALPHLNGLDASQQVKQKLPGVKLLFLTMNRDPELAAEAFRRGASGYVLKHAGAEELLIAIRKVMRGESFLSSGITRDTMIYLLRQPPPQEGARHITPRQVEILQLLAEGQSMKQIAATLDISPGTVAFHKYSMMEKLGTLNNAELLRYAIKHHMISA